MTTTGAEARRRRIRVALVDDHRLLVEGLAARLSVPRAHIEVVAAVTDWGHLLAHPEFPVDVVVVEFGLEDDVPFETKVQQLADIGVSAIALARNRDAATVHAALTAGALTLVPKSEPAEQLVAAVHAAADGRAHHSPAVQDALDAWANRADPNLGRQELAALQLYAQGRSVHEVALQMATTDQTAKSYIKRGRRKYRVAGVDLGTKVLLRRHAIREGWIAPE